MLWISLIFSGIILGTSYFRMCAGSVGVALGLTLVSAMLGCLLPCVAIQTLIFLAIFAIWKFWNHTYRARCMATSVATLLIYVVYGSVIVSDWPQLRRVNPFESIEARLPKRSTEQTHQALANDWALDEFEDEVFRAAHTSYFNGNKRAYHLRLLHEDTVQAFVDSFGFGVGRLTQLGSPVTASSLNDKLRGELPVRQPGSKSLDLLSTGAAGRLTSVPVDSRLQSLHRKGLVDFLYPAGFGYFKDRGHVAGFRPHQFSQVPEAGQPLKVEVLELVGLVVHEEPVVYISDLLPRMEAVRNAPIRPLDAVEQKGLAELRRGNELFVCSQNRSVRMLGAIRATKQCTSCHDCERGELLGAFSYIFAKANP